MAKIKDIPLCIDLDGTLLRTDMLHESLLGLLKRTPLAWAQIPFMLRSGKAGFKSLTAKNYHFDPTVLPYNEELLSWLQRQREEGRRLILCTASDRTIAETISQYLGIFDEVLASDGSTNLSGQTKARILVERFGEKGFDYAGNGQPDLQVWKKARRAITVNASRRLQRKVRGVAPTELNLSEPKLRLDAWFKALRPCIGLRFFGHVLSLITQPRSWPLFGWPGRLPEFCSHDAQ